jgi:tight adherence protein B
MESSWLQFLAAPAVFVLFLPFVMVAARTSKDERRRQARFAMLQTGGAGGLSSGKQTELLKDVEQTPVGGFHTVVSRVTTGAKLDVLLLQANSQQTSSALLRHCSFFASAAMLIICLATRSLLVGVPLGLGAGLIPWLRLKLRATKRTDGMNKALPQVMDMISRALRAGHSLPAALGIVAEEAPEPARSAFAEVFQKQKFGLPLREALMEMIRCFSSEDLKVLVTAMLVQRETGGNLIQILDRTSTVIRERLKLQGDVRVHTAQGRMTGWVLCLLPVLMLCMLLLTDPSYPKVLLDDPLGRKLTCAGVALLALGAFLIHRIVKGIEV